MNNNNLPLVESIIRNSGLVVTKSPSINHPIPVALVYRYNPDGSLCWLWPEGSKDAIFSKLPDIGSLKAKVVSNFNRLLFSLRLGGLVAHGKLVIYADVPTATYIVKRWGH